MLRDFIAGIRNVGVAIVTVAAVGIAPLSACGVKGPLKLPAAPAAGAPAADSQPKPAPETFTEPAPQPPSTAP